MKATEKQINLLRKISPLKEAELQELTTKEADTKIKEYLKKENEYRYNKAESDFFRCFQRDYR